MKATSTFRRKFKRKLVIVLTAIAVMVVVVILCISPLTKYLVEKYDKEYTGREITMDWAYVNPFTGYVHFHDLKVYESGNDSVFFSAGGISINVALLKLLTSTYELSEFSLNQPRTIILQKDSAFNFDDLLERFLPKPDADTTKPPIQFNVFNISIANGEIYYRESITPIDYSIKKVNFESPGIEWDVDTINANYSFAAGIGTGDVKGDFTFNLKNKRYRTAVVIKKFDLNIIEQYLKDLTNYGSFSANIDAEMRAEGNIEDQEDVVARGSFAVNDFHFGKNEREDFAAFDKLAVSVKELSPKNFIYHYDSISVVRPYFKYERYDYLDNIQTMFGKEGANIVAANGKKGRFNLILEIADYVQVITKNFFQSAYKIGRFAVYEADLKFNDYSLSEKFSADLSPLYIISDSIDKNHKRIKMSVQSGIKPYGSLAVNLSVNPMDSSDFDIYYSMKQLPIAMFNPYTISYTSFAMDKGTIEFSGVWNVRNGNIQSTNHVLIIDPRLTKRRRNKDLTWMPVPLVMAFVKERGNVIDYEIPITGNLKDPKLHLRDAILDLIENIFVKPPTTPYRLEVRNTEEEIEKSLALKWQKRQSVLSGSQEKFMKRMAEFLVEYPEASIDIYPQSYSLKEKEYILFFEAKKKYFLRINKITNDAFSKRDSLTVDKMSVKDSLFVHYLDTHSDNKMLFTIQEKCDRFLEKGTVERKYLELNLQREKNFLLFFKEHKVIDRVRMHTVESLIPYGGFSFYKLMYKKEFPEALIKAYKKMDEWNDEAPRKKFDKIRRSNKIVV